MEEDTPTSRAAASPEAGSRTVFDPALSVCEAPMPGVGELETDSLWELGCSFLGELPVRLQRTEPMFAVGKLETDSPPARPMLPVPLS